VTQQNTSAQAPKRFSSNRGQGLLEFALVLPVLLILIAGIVEIGIYANVYLTVLDATREAARFGANLDPLLTSHHPFDMYGDPYPDVRPPEIDGPMTDEDLREICRLGDTTNFYYEVACLAVQNLPVGTLNAAEDDDVTITVVGIRDGAIEYRWPLASHAHPDDQDYHFKGPSDGNISWSLYGVRASEFDDTQIASQLVADAPETGFVIVEIFHAHHQLIGVFRIGDFLPDPIVVRPYTIFPVAAAEPD
jgi:hypothetical protein